MKDFLKVLVYAGLFAVPFLTLYVENDYFFPFITGKNFWFRIIVDVTLAAWVVLALYDAKYRPKFSWIAASFGIFLVVMFFANLFGEYPRASFWSNFERMDGYVSLVHTFLYVVLLGSVLHTKRQWQYFLNTSLVVASLVAFYGLAQYGGLVDGASRIDSRLGNAAYMAVYMLFHIFISFWLFAETKNAGLKVLYGALAAMFTFVLIETGTRGTAIGLAVGVTVMSGYIGLFGAQYKVYRTYAAGTFLLLIFAASAFVAFRDSAVVQNNNNLSRIANISFEDLEVRAMIWGMAWEGVQERPLLGWGQSNFNYVFNKHYDPRIYDQEQWFDRAHNIFMDWLIAGGALGLVSYLGIFLAAVYYLFWRPLWQKDETFTVLERGILLGILAGYFTHNFVVFDNIISYIFFAVILGYIHSRVATPISALARLKVETNVINQVALPSAVVAVGAVIYFVHVPGMLAAGDIIKAFQAQDPEVKLEIFERALDRDTFAQQEITEQMAQQAMQLARQEQVPPEARQEFAAATEARLLELAEEKPGDARVHVFIGSYYRTMGQYEKAAEQFALAREFSPTKPAIVVQQGFTELSRGNNQQAVEFFNDAYELEPENLQAKTYYAGSLFYVDRAEDAKALMDDAETRQQFASSDFLISSANQFEEYEFAAELFEIRSETEPDQNQQWQQNPQTWATLAFLQYQSGNTASSVATLREGAELLPSFASSAACFIDNIENDRDPRAGC